MPALVWKVELKILYSIDSARKYIERRTQLQLQGIDQSFEVCLPMPSVHPSVCIMNRE